MIYLKSHRYLVLELERINESVKKKEVPLISKPVNNKKTCGKKVLVCIGNNTRALSFITPEKSFVSGPHSTCQEPDKPR